MFHFNQCNCIRFILIADVLVCCSCGTVHLDDSILQLAGLSYRILKYRTPLSALIHKINQYSFSLKRLQTVDCWVLQALFASSWAKIIDLCPFCKWTVSSWHPSHVTPGYMCSFHPSDRCYPNNIIGFCHLLASILYFM